MALPRNDTVNWARARELYKYFRPPVADHAAPDTVLTSHAQLVAWRLNVERAMVSLIDEELSGYLW